MMTEKIQGVSKTKIFAIGSGFFALMLIWTFYNAYMPLILGDFIESRGIRGMIMGLDNLFAVLLIPIIGTWSDRINTRFGNRLPFLIVGMPIAAVFFALIPYGAMVSLWVLLVVDIVFLLAMTVYRAPVIALMPDHTPPAYRSTANGIINFMGGVGAIVALFGLSTLYGIDRTYPFILAGLLLLFAFILLYFVVDRHPPYADATADDLEEVKATGSLKTMFKKILLPDFRGQFYILLAIFIYFIGYAAVEALFTVYAVEHLGMAEDAAGFTLGFFSLSFVLFAIPAGIIGTKIGKAPAMSIGLLALPAVFFLIPTLPLIDGAVFGMSHLTLLPIVLLIGGIFWAFVNVQAYPLVADLGGTNKIGFFTGLYYLFSMGASIIAPGVLGLMMDLFGAPALFYGSAVTFLFGYWSLNKGVKILRGVR
ncbi:MFS transporter [Salisediminibacterium selenitireducens]|uniref:Major facilitator superfamily MFS_1 n=1 Tax=Bacillus selenitireducens (strain ATCC 700615 / DSM 15326 / MLS10) TaxID=439292 RepID=D6XYP0_BACIE|nr:MFS transporter [Salisediminibacterium selenitireducens]ADH98198.1 major facilitator superfamily MFS_1 [[Bacillus] selenitireducens MLS10]